MITQASILFFQAEKAVYEFVLIEDQQVFDFFPYADEFNGYFKLIGDRQDYAAFCRAVQFGNGQGGYIGSSDELPGLLQSVLPGGTIQDQLYLMGCVGHYFFNDPADLPQFLHQVGFVVQTACRIDDHDIRSSCDPALNGIECHSAGI